MPGVAPVTKQQGAYVGKPSQPNSKARRSSVRYRDFWLAGRHRPEEHHDSGGAIAAHGAGRLALVVRGAGIYFLIGFRGGVSQL